MDSQSEIISLEDAPHPTIHQVAFRGTGGGYFAIWLVNITLTVLTLGIYSAWAKVRTRRYFYGSTEVAGHRLDYTADPVRILIGRVIAITALVLFNLFSALSPAAAGGLAIAFAVGVAFASWYSLRFNARNTVYRNVRFGFDGDQGRAVIVFFLWPLATALTLGLLAPLAHRRLADYVASGYRYGSHRFQVDLRTKRFYVIYLMVALGMIPLLITGFVLAGALEAVTVGFETEEPGAGAALVLIIILGSVALAGRVLSALVTNEVFNNLALPAGPFEPARADAPDAPDAPDAVYHRFSSTMSGVRIAWIYISNMLLIALTLGLFLPFARVRLAKYRADCTRLLAASDLDEFVETTEQEVAALGEELADLGGFEVGF